MPGALYEITKSDEKKLDLYEDFPTLYNKMYFKYTKTLHFKKQSTTYYISKQIEAYKT